MTNREAMDQDNSRLPMKMSLGEENMVLLQKLDINSQRFASALRERLLPTDTFEQVLEDNETMRFYVTRDGSRQVLFECTWDLLGTFEEIETEDLPKKDYVWTWGWHIFPEEPSQQKIKDLLVDIPVDMDPIVNPVIVSHESIFISYIMAFMTNKMELDHIYTRAGEENHNSVFALRNIKWVMPPLPKMQLNTEEVTKDAITKDG